MHNKNMKVKVHSPNGDTDFLDIVASVLQGDTLDPYLFIILPRLHTSNVDRSNEKKWLVGWVLWHINPYRLFNSKSILT